MIKILKSLFAVLFFSLICANVFIFVSGIKIGARINSLENNITQLKKENLELENKVVEMNSFQYASSMAASLDFTIKAQPIYISNPAYALNR